MSYQQKNGVADLGPKYQLDGPGHEAPAQVGKDLAAQLDGTCMHRCSKSSVGSNLVLPLSMPDKFT